LLENIKTEHDLHLFLTPPEFANLKDKAPFDRMVVAYGLSTLIPELHEYVLPS